MEPDLCESLNRPFWPAVDNLTYPKPHCKSPRLNFTPEVAKELVLLAELAGWEPFVPAMLDMATRPDECLGSLGSFGCGHTDLKQMLAGFTALNILQSKHIYSAQVSPYSCSAVMPIRKNALLASWTCCYFRCWVLRLKLAF